jgi:hypothetical protein
MQHAAALKPSYEIAEKIFLLDIPERWLRSSAHESHLRLSDNHAFMPLIWPFLCVCTPDSAAGVKQGIAVSTGRRPSEHPLVAIRYSLPLHVPNTLFTVFREHW